MPTAAAWAVGENEASTGSSGSSGSSGGSGGSGGSSSGSSGAFWWTGTTWISVPTGADASLLAVAATSASDAWAVGYAFLGLPQAANYLPRETVILHWNGKAWEG